MFKTVVKNLDGYGTYLRHDYKEKRREKKREEERE